jgi:hypothetical protein
VGSSVARNRTQHVPAPNFLGGKVAEGAASLHDLQTIVGNDHKASFSHYRDGNFFYVVRVQDQNYSFPIPVEDAKGTTLFAEFKAITLMRWIRKALDDKTFQPVKP